MPRICINGNGNYRLTSIDRFVPVSYVFPRLSSAFLGFPRRLDFVQAYVQAVTRSSLVERDDAPASSNIPSSREAGFFSSRLGSRVVRFIDGRRRERTSSSPPGESRPNEREGSGDSRIAGKNAAVSRRRRRETLARYSILDTRYSKSGELGRRRCRGAWSRDRYLVHETRGARARARAREITRMLYTLIILPEYCRCKAMLRRNVVAESSRRRADDAMSR